MSIAILISLMMSAAALAVGVLIAIWAIESASRRSKAARHSAERPPARHERNFAEGDFAERAREDRSGGDGHPGRSEAELADARSDRWMAYYFAGLAVLLAFAFIYYARAGFLETLRTAEGRSFYRSDIFDILAFVVAAVIYPFILRHVLEKRRSRRSGTSSSGGGTGRREDVTSDRPSSPRQSLS